MKASTEDDGKIQRVDEYSDFGTQTEQIVTKVDLGNEKSKTRLEINRRFFFFNTHLKKFVICVKLKTGTGDNRFILHHSPLHE